MSGQWFLMHRVEESFGRATCQRWYLRDNGRAARISESRFVMRVELSLNSMCPSPFWHEEEPKAYNFLSNEGHIQQHSIWNLFHRSIPSVGVIAGNCFINPSSQIVGGSILHIPAAAFRPMTLKNRPMQYQC